MKKNLTISIAAYNVEKYIKETLDSLICKNMNLLEVLIIDDGSKDNTAKIAKKYEEKYKGVFKVISKKMVDMVQQLIQELNMLQENILNNLMVTINMILII